MQNFLAFLQSVEILGKWVAAAIRNYHITLGIMMFFDMVDRIYSKTTRPIAWWEVLFTALIFIKIYKKCSPKKDIHQTHSNVINIENKI